MRILFKFLALLWMSHAAYATIIYGVEPLQQNKAPPLRYPIYIQVGSFSNIHNAQHLQHQLSTSSQIPVVIRSSKGLHKVIIGPFYDQASLKLLASKVSNIKHRLASKSKWAYRLSNSPIAIPSVRPKRLPLDEKSVVPEPPLVLMQRTSHPEFSIFLGNSYIPNTINGQTLQLLPYEIGEYADTFTHQSKADAFTWGLRAQYRFNLHAPAPQNYFFNALGAGIDFFQITNFNQTGKVLQFNLPEFENYTYKLNLKNIRVMANLDLDFHPIGSYITPFIEGGVGGARTTVSYDSVAIPPVVSPNFTLPAKASWNFSYQAGAGVKFITTYHLAFSLRYLYANMGKADSSTWGSSTTLATPLRATMSTQNLLFGLTYLME